MEKNTIIVLLALVFLVLLYSVCRKLLKPDKQQKKERFYSMDEIKNFLDN